MQLQAFFRATFCVSTTSSMILVGSWLVYGSHFMSELGRRDISKPDRSLVHNEEQVAIWSAPGCSIYFVDLSTGFPRVLG